MEVFLFAVLWYMVWK